jgi:capsular exopolysaccharide synthesis family protein
MDYIQKAIDKARDQRDGQIGQNQEEDIGSNKSVKNAAASDAVKKAGIKEGINYTSTRQVNVDEDTLKNNRVIAGFNYDERAEPYRQLRTQVLQKLRANNWKTLAITSPGEGVGKTLTAINLAISLSKEVNQTVMLVDLDLRSPSILQVLGIEAEQGLVDHLEGRVSVSEILINPGFERLVLLPGRPDPSYSSEILSSPEMNSLIKDLTSRYESRIIIFDLPALLVTDDALVFTPVVDAALLVVEDGVTTPADVERSMLLLEGTHVLGTILNKAE